MSCDSPKSNLQSQSCRGTAAFELMAVVSIAGLVTSSLIPLLASSVEIDDIRRTFLIDKQEDYLFAMEAEGLGLPVEYLPATFEIESDEDESEEDTL